jgi:trk system potassium uptake protein TrkH
MATSLFLTIKRISYIGLVLFSDVKKLLEFFLNLFSSLGALLILLLLIIEFAFPPSAQQVSGYFFIHHYIIYAFIIDIILRFVFFKKNRWLTFLFRPTDLLVFVPFVITLIIPNFGFTFFMSQVLLLLLLIGRMGHMSFLTNLFKVRPAQFILIGFIFLIFIGALLLVLPNASVEGKQLSFIDALFTSCSAVCVTGLAVNDIGRDFSLFGQIVLLLLVQIGGLGIMTFSVFLSMILGKRISQADTLELQESYSTYNFKETASSIGFIFKFTLFFECLGALFLGLFTFRSIESFPDRVFYSVFHSVSSFCNAGFALYSDSLIGFQTHFPTVFIISTLIIFGGLGFPVLFNLNQRLQHKNEPLRMGTKLALLVTGVLIIVGTLGILALEYNRSLSGYMLFDKVLVSYFQAVSARTAGLNSIDLNLFHSTSIMLLMGLMIIGASPGSTGGGIKTTAFGVVAISFWNILKNSFRFDFGGRTIDHYSAFKAFSVVITAVIVIFSGVFVLMLVESLPFKKILFEAISAFGTVGFSLGITADLSSYGKGIIIIMMFIGRIGPLGFLYSLFKPKAAVSYVLPVEKVTVV